MPTNNDKEIILQGIVKRLSKALDAINPVKSKNVIEEFNNLQNDLLPIIKDVQFSLFTEGKMSPKMQKMYNDIKTIQSKMQEQYAPLYNINDALQNEISIIDQLAASLPSKQETSKKGLTSTEKMTMLMNLKKMKPDEIKKAMLEIKGNSKDQHKPVDLTSISKSTNTAFGDTKIEQKSQSRMIKAAYERAMKMELEERQKGEKQTIMPSKRR